MFASCRLFFFRAFGALFIIVLFNGIITRAQQSAPMIPAITTTPSPSPTITPNAKSSPDTAMKATEVPAPYRINYHLMMSRPQSHLFEVSMTIETPQPTEFVDVQIPRWSPGRYAIFDFATNVQEVNATLPCPPNKNSPEIVRCESVILPVERIDNQTWRVKTHVANRFIQSSTVSYKVFGDDLSGTFSQLDARHANFNGGSIFMYAVGHKQDAVSLHIEPPNNWRIANGRMTRDDQRDWQFPNYDEMIDTPTEIAPDFTIDKFEVDGKTYRVMVHSFGDEGGRRPQLVKDIERIVRAETLMWGAPEFDSYMFLITFAGDGHSGDGMEHLTSTNIIEPGILADKNTYDETLDTVAHEFFHVWNVKRLRPVGLGPWDFTQPVVTHGLWIAEGFTNYYGHLMQRRAGIWNDEKFLTTLGAYITGVENAPGSRLMSAEESSLVAPLIDGATHEQRTNLLNNSISYYPKGEVVGLTLDLLIRGRTNGAKSLDDVMRRAYEEFYFKSPNDSYYLHGRGYTNEEFARIASEVAGFDLSDFFRRYARGREMPPYDEAFKSVGLKLMKVAAREPFSGGIVADERDPQNPKIVAVRNDSPAERARLEQGDVLISIGKTDVTAAMWRAALNLYKTGETVPVAVRRNRQTINVTLKLDAPDRYEYRLEDIKDITPEQRTRRTAWMSAGVEMKLKAAQ